MTSHERHNETKAPEQPYDPKRQIKEDEEKMARDAMRGVFVVLIVMGSIGIGAFFALYAEESYRAAHPPEILNKKTWGTSPEHMFTNPVLFVDGDKGNYPEFHSFDNELNGYIDEAKRKGMVESVSIYFRDLNSGHWTGVNEDDEYAATDDMRNVLLMLAYDKAAEHDPTILSQELYYQNDQSSGHLANGFYSVQDLIGDMIRYSDDTAEKVLAAYHPEYSTLAYKDFPASKSISARGYAAIFHDLYNGTYLSPSVSEQDLRLLASTIWNKGIVAGMLSGIAADPDAGAADDATLDATSTTPVAHAFGEYSAVSSSDTVTGRELHDCGIVYFPAKPYLLCVMTRGDAAGSFSVLAGVISTISRLTYNYVDGQ